MRNGKVYELPTQAHLITGSEFSSLPTQDTRLMPTPNTMDHLPARTPEQKALNKHKGGYANVRETVVNDLMPTPKARDSQAEGYEAGLRRATPQVGTIVKGLVDGDPRVLIPTPTTRDYKDGQSEHERDGVVQTDTVARAIFNSGEVLLPTTRTSMANGPTQKEIALGNPKTRIETEVMLGGTSWGKFEPAIRRWEQTLGRPSPLPTKPDGKDGAHRLSSAFTEWMMGLPEGWVTGVGLTRNEELKACGNGVVPQQAELALRILLEGVTLPAGGGHVNLPTPTVSDTYTDNLKSTQQKEGSMHSVTLPQAVRWVSNEHSSK
jgi:DNA (cytosine-5)-methyltransferase 1